MISAHFIQTNRSGQHLTVPHNYPVQSVCCSNFGAGVGVDTAVTYIKHEKDAKICLLLRCAITFKVISRHAFSSETGEAELRLDVPDSITTWVTEAVSLSQDKGLGLAKRAELRTFKPFFVDFTLPYSLIRGEQTKVPLTVYNYLPTCAEVRWWMRGQMEQAQVTVQHMHIKQQLSLHSTDFTVFISSKAA